MSDDTNLLSRNHHISLEEFRNKFSDFGQEDRTLLDKASDIYDKIPTIIRIGKNFDPTGLLGSIDDVFSDNRSRREQNRIVDGLYHLHRYNLDFATTIKAALEQYREEFLSITEFYLYSCKETYDEKKIRYYARIWFECVTSHDVSLDEKEYIFTLISSLTTDQIKVLKFIYDKVSTMLKENEESGKRPFGIKGFAETNKLNYAYVQQICIDLQGKGLLIPGAESFVSSNPHSFSTSDYVDTVIKYLKEVIDEET